MKLTDEIILAAQPKNNNYRIFAGNYLYLVVAQSGKKTWRYIRRNTQCRKNIKIGDYPETSIKEALCMAHNILNNISYVKKPKNNVSKPKNKIIPKGYEDFPKELLNQLRFKTTLVEMILKLLHNYGSLELDDILIKIYRTYNIIEKKRNIVMALYSLKKKKKVYSPKKGFYSINIHKETK